MEQWNDGMMSYRYLLLSNIVYPIFQYSILPSFQLKGHYSLIPFFHLLYPLRFVGIIYDF